MPHKHSIKIYVENSFYHVYNRGVEKRKIFLDDQDYAVFLHLLKYYLSPSLKDLHPLQKLPDYKPKRSRPLKNLSEEIELHSFCLMPNHFHLMIRQKTKRGMEKLLRKLTTTYAMYFNRRYDRVGYLFQGRYKASLIDGDNYLLHLSRYIHLNPKELEKNLSEYPYSSYPFYLGKKSADWLTTDFLLRYFDKNGLLPYLKRYPSYKNFVEGNTTDPAEVLGELTLE